MKTFAWILAFLVALVAALVVVVAAGQARPWPDCTQSGGDRQRTGWRTDRMRLPRGIAFYVLRSRAVKRDDPLRRAPLATASPSKRVETMLGSPKGEESTEQILSDADPQLESPTALYRNGRCFMPQIVLFANSCFREF
jgi:hypothetical protein